MNRRLFLTVLGASLAAPAAADAQSKGKIYRVGAFIEPDRLDTLRQGLGELGYREGQNVVIEHRSAQGSFEQIPALAAGLVRLGPDVIVVAGSENVQALKNATRAIPLVMVSVGDPVERGFVASLARPGGNITGLSNVTDDLAGKWLELLREVDPGITRIAVLWNPPQPGHRAILGALELAAPSLGVRLQLLAIETLDDLEAAFAAARREKAGGLTMLGSGLHFRNLRRIADLANRSKLPAVSWNRDFVRFGGLMTYGVSDRDHYRRAATYVDRILKGANPAELPVEQPTTFRLVINLKTARTLGLTISQALLVRADEVIQ